MQAKTTGTGGLVYVLAEGRRRPQPRQDRTIRPLARTSQGKHGVTFGGKVAPGHQRQMAGDEGESGSGSMEIVLLSWRLEEIPPLLAPRISAMDGPARTTSGFV